jgi:hypothetical protein
VKRQEERKYHKGLLQIIEKFKEKKSAELISTNEIFNKRSVEFQSYKKHFSISIEYDIFSEKQKSLKIGEYHKGIQIQFGSALYILENLFLNTLSTSRITGQIDRIRTIDFSKKQECYYNLIIPLEKQLDFLFQISQINFTTDLGYHSCNGTRATINDDSIQVYCIHNDKKEYFLAIDSDKKQTFEEFSEKASAVKIGIGYLSGFFAGDQGFYFAYTQKDKKEPKDFYCLSLRDSIKSNFKPINSNAYSYLHDNVHLAEKYKRLLQPVSLNQFSILCQKIHDSTDFAGMLMLMLESSVASLLFKPGGYAIALETLSDLVTANSKLKLAPIKDKSISKKIRKEILEVIYKNSSTIVPDDLIVLQKRIDQLNQPTNKSRLKAPFDLLNISINDEDLKILETRNDFLHGRVPDLTNEGSNRSIDRINKDLFYCSMRFYTLLNMIILKWIGYDNRVVNYPKIQENFIGIYLDEEPFRQV